MEIKALIREMEISVGEIELHRKNKKGISSPKVKEWRTRCEKLLREGGKNCANNLKKFNSLRFEPPKNANDFVKEQSYLAEMDSARKILKSSIQALDFFGRPEDKEQISWGRPRDKVRAIGAIKIDNREIDVKNVSIKEFLLCLDNMVEATKDLGDDQKKAMRERLTAMIESDILDTFLNIKLDKMLAYWPE